MSAPGEWLDNLRYDHPAAFGVAVVCGSLVAAAACFMALPESPLLEAMGVNGVQRRVSASFEAVYWSSRALIHTGDDDVPVSVFGNVDGVASDGRLIVSVPEGAKWVHRRLALANAQVVDVYGAARIVGEVRSDNARFEIYPPDRAVVWIRAAPLNVKLIEAGVAKPDPNPRTNIFDLAFAAYYWSVAKGGAPKEKSE